MRFREGGSLSGADGDVGGRWWWSRGHLHVALDGIPETSAYPWRALAAREQGLLNVNPGGAADGGESAAQ